MMTSFLLLALAGGVVRLGLGLVLWQRTGVVLACPSLLAAGLVVLAALPDVVSPIPFPLPLGLTLGFLLPDLLLRRVS
ncbi:MAG: hypothetical protein NXH94_12355 [Rhodobacteraceae bacterium]|nr:hypothetical protein [Paracoccaceae bacterium]